MNTFGNIYRLTSFGESHGPAIGGIIDGMPPGLKINMQQLQQCMDRRRPGVSAVSSARNEADRVELLSGVFEGVTTGAPIGFIIANSDARSTDYEPLRHAFRPGHADYTYQTKYGIRDYRGGGRASARETAVRVLAGALAMQALRLYGISVRAWTSQIGGIKATPYPFATGADCPVDMDAVWASEVRCPDTLAAADMTAAIGRAAAEGDSLGGLVSCVVSGAPAGLGEPLFDKLQARLAAAMMSIPAAKGFDYGLGFDGCSRCGSEVVDEFVPDGRGGVTTAANFSGGIQGGISNGRDIYMRVAFKPVATLRRPLGTVNDRGEAVSLEMSGRHDACVVPRAVAVVQSMAACVIFDALLADMSIPNLANPNDLP